MYSPRRYFPQGNLAGHHLLTFYLRELSIVAHKLGRAELALPHVGPVGTTALRGESPRESPCSIVVSPWSGVVSLFATEGSGLGEGTSSTGAG